MSLSVGEGIGGYPGYQLVSCAGLLMNSFVPITGNGIIIDPQAMRGMWGNDSGPWGYSGAKVGPGPSGMPSHEKPVGISQRLDENRGPRTRPPTGFVLCPTRNAVEISKARRDVRRLDNSQMPGSPGKENAEYHFVPAMCKGNPQGVLGMGGPPVIFMGQNTPATAGYVPNQVNGQAFNPVPVLPQGPPLKSEETLPIGVSSGRVDLGGSELSPGRTGDINSSSIIGASPPLCTKRTGKKYPGGPPEPGHKTYSGPQAWVNHGDGWKSLALEGPK